MSNDILNPAWKLDIKSSPKLVLISLADQANDDGICICGIHHLMNRTGLSERAVQAQLNYLEDIGAVKRRRRRHQVTVYRVTPEAAQCPRIVKIVRTVDEFDAMGSGAPYFQKARPADSAGLEFKTRKKRNQDPQNLQPEGAAAAPITILNHSSQPSTRAGDRWVGLSKLWPKKGKIEEAETLYLALTDDEQEFVLALVPVLLNSPDWRADRGHWIPTLPAFLGKGRWRLFPDPRLRLVPPAPTVVVPPGPLTVEARERGSAAAREAIAVAKRGGNG